MKALIVDVDLALADVVSFTLRRAGYEVIVANDGAMALERWKLEMPDIIILDINLPKLNGLEVCRRIRAASKTPIVILSVREDDDDVVTALRYGADDYVVKPFSPRQLVARVESALRHSGVDNPTPDQLVVGDLILDCLRGEVYVGEEMLGRLTHLENLLLQTLMLNKNQTLPSETLIDHVWGPAGGDKAMLKQLIYRLRTKLGSASMETHLETVPGVGYSLIVERKPVK
jgi:DNA-binding response OmpR family regulator